MKTVWIFLFTFLISLPVAPFFPDQTDPEVFFENLKTLCGSSYPGVVVFPDTPPQGFTDPMVAHFRFCGENEIQIPFHVGSNESRTWILTRSEEGVLFKHDHRHPDGRPERMTGYGGWAAGGSEYMQQFPADAETIAIRESLASHTWQMDLSEDGSRFSYSLYLNGELYFQADFDLLSPM